MEALIGIIIILVCILCFIACYQYIPEQERLDQIVPVAQEVPDAVVIEPQTLHF